jgi:hypothetical protein
MRKYSFMFALLALLVCSGLAFAGTKLLKDTSKQMNPIQNLSGIAPTAGKSRCTTTATATKGNTTFTGYTTAGYLGAKAQVVTSAGVAQVVTWTEDGVPVWVGSTYDIVNGSGTAVSKVRWVYTNTSSASQTLSTCFRRQ